MTFIVNWHSINKTELNEVYLKESKIVLPSN